MADLIPLGQVIARSTDSSSKPQFCFIPFRVFFLGLLFVLFLLRGQSTQVVLLHAFYDVLDNNIECQLCIRRGESREGEYGVTPKVTPACYS